jgi:hypothetical protein
VLAERLHEIARQMDALARLEARPVLEKNRAIVLEWRVLLEHEYKRVRATRVEANSS